MILATPIEPAQLEADPHHLVRCQNHRHYVGWLAVCSVGCCYWTCTCVGLAPWEKKPGGRISSENILIRRNSYQKNWNLYQVPVSLCPIITYAPVFSTRRYIDTVVLKSTVLHSCYTYCALGRMSKETEEALSSRTPLYDDCSSGWYINVR
jgi:hypothetical protein